MKNSIYLALRIAGIVTFCVVLPLSVFAQGKPSTFVRAEESFYEEEFETALILFNQYLEGSPNHGQAQYYAEICSLLTYYPKKPLDKFLEFESTFGVSDKFYFYWTGRIHAARYEYGSALVAWQKFLELKNYKSKVITDETNAFIADAHIKKAFIDVPSNFSVHQLPEPINTINSEENPILFDNESKLMLASVADNDSKRKQRSTIFFFNRLGQNKWSTAESDPAFLDMKGNIVNLQLYDNETKLLLYYDDKKGDLYVSNKEGDKWSNPEPLDQIDRSGMQISGFFTQNEEMLIYTAESKANKDDLDLFMVTKTGDQQWSAPVELTELNTPFVEDSPFITPDGTEMYFSSRGHSSIGGFDIFKTSRDKSTNKWSTPVNMGYPINTPGDEIFFKFNKDGKTGFLSSNRAGTIGFFDAFFFIEEIKVPMKGRIIARESQIPLKEVRIKVNPSNPYLNTLSAESNIDGNFEVLLTSGFDQEFEFSIDGKLVHSEKVSFSANNVVDTLTRTFEIDLPQSLLAQARAIKESRMKQVASSSSNADSTEPLKTTLPDSRVVEYTELNDLGKKFSKGNKAILENIYFEPGSDYVSSAYTPELEALYEVMKNNPQLRIEIGGHSDPLEEAASTVNLSKLRARSVGAYLIQRLIADDRIEEVGYGATQPLASNDNEKDGREINRRIEVLVIE